MANQKLNIDIVAKDKSKQALNRLQGSLSKVKGAVFNLKNAFLGLGAGLVLRGIVNAGMQIEELGVQLEALFGSARKGKAALDTVTKFAKTTPFELSNIQQGVTALATVSEKAESLGISFEELLKITGNTAVQLGGDFALASQQIQRSFSAGIGSADLFRDRAVTAMAGFSAGVKVSVDESIKGLAKAFGTGGKFGELTNKLAQTLKGTISNLKDAFFTIQTEIAKGFFDELKAQLGDLKKFTETNDEAIRRISREIGQNLAVAILKLSSAIKALVKNFRELQSILGILMIAFGGFFTKIAGGALIIDDINRRINKLAGVTKEVKEEMQSFYDLVNSEEANMGFVETLESSLQIIHDFEHELSVAIPNATQKAISKFEELNNTALENIRNKFSDIRTTIAEGLNAGVTKFSNALSRAIILGEDLGKSFKQMVADALVNTLALLIEVVIRMGIQKILGDKLLLGENKRLNSAKKYTGELQKQVALAAILAFLTGGGSMSGGSGSSFRASGGSVQKDKPYMVGENGPELFVPNQTGQIHQSARGGGNNGAVNVNFHINAVNAAGIDQLLIERRGTISRIINESVNERGRGAII
jgi:hypothetical protein